jgi:hypothetical protein
MAIAEQKIAAKSEDKLSDAEPGYARLITLMQPERLMSPPPWVGHIPFAFWIVDVMRPRRFVELGTHSGNSFCAFLQAAAAVSATGEFFAVDHWRGDEHAGRYEEEIYQDLKRYVETRYGSSSALLRMSFDQALERFDDGSIDLLHIDGLHTYEAVRHDFDGWLPKMSDRGIVLLHDTFVRERDFGVHQLLAQLGERYPTFEFVHSHGLGIVQTGTAEPVEPLAKLLGGNADRQGLDPRAYFERLGNSLVDRYYLELLSNQVERNEALEEELASVQHRKRELEMALASRPPMRPALARYQLQMTAKLNSAAASSQAKLILGSGFFDPRSYRERAGLEEVDAFSLAQHYLDSGEAAGLAPSCHFDPQFYRAKYPDVAAKGMNMLAHYVAYGRAECRIPKAPDAADQAPDPLSS